MLLTALKPDSPPRSTTRGGIRRTSSRVYLSFGDVVARYAGVWSTWQLYEWTRTGQIPHRKLPGRRELLFLLDELESFEDGAELETVRLPRGGRVCRPRSRSNP